MEEQKNESQVQQINQQPVPEKQAQPEVQGQQQVQLEVKEQQQVQQAGQPAVGGIQIPEILKKAGQQPPVGSEDKIWGLVSYIPLMALMALVLKPGSEFIKLHGRQGLLITFIFFFSIFVYLVPYIGPVIGILIHLMAIIVGIFSMYQAFIGNWWKIPVLGDVAELIPADMFAKVTREAVMGAKVSEEIEEKAKEEEERKMGENIVTAQPEEQKEEQPVQQKEIETNPQQKIPGSEV